MLFHKTIRKCNNTNNLGYIATGIFNNRQYDSKLYIDNIQNPNNFNQYIIKLFQFTIDGPTKYLVRINPFTIQQYDENDSIKNIRYAIINKL